MTSKKPSSVRHNDSCSIANDYLFQRTTSTFADMWLLFPYGMIPSIMYGPSFGMTSVAFAMKYLLTWVLESGMLGGSSGGSSGGTGGGSSSGGSLIDMNFLMQVATNAILAMPWFVLLFPLVQSVLALVCLRMFREQVRNQMSRVFTFDEAENIRVKPCEVDYGVRGFYGEIDVRSKKLSAENMGDVIENVKVRRKRKTIRFLTHLPLSVLLHDFLRSDLRWKACKDRNVERLRLE